MAKKATLALGVLAAAGAALGWAAAELPRQFGARPAPRRMGASPQWRDGKFRNRASASTMAVSGGDLLRAAVADRAMRRPRQPIPVVTAAFTAPADSAEGLHVTWYGHSSALLEIEGSRILFDPVWSERCSPSRFVGPRRLHPPPLPIDQLPHLDAIVISHDHYDHLDLASVEALARTQDASFLVPLGVGDHLRRWGVAEGRIVELDWDQSFPLGDLTITATEARHFSGRGFRRDETLWASWVLSGPTRRAFYTGDSGYFAGYEGIGTTYGPFDVTLVQIGAYGDGWPDIHMKPEDAVRAHKAVGGGLMVPLHWGTFVLAFHDWAEPADRLWAEAKAEDVTIVVPRPGERVDVDDPPAVDGWWQAIA